LFCRKTNTFAQGQPQTTILLSLSPRNYKHGSPHLACSLTLGIVNFFDWAGFRLQPSYLHLWLQAWASVSDFIFFTFSSRYLIGKQNTPIAT
jgi:hypothetical protein